MLDLLVKMGSTTLPWSLTVPAYLLNAPRNRYLINDETNSETNGPIPRACFPLTLVVVPILTVRLPGLIGRCSHRLSTHCLRSLRSLGHT